jgi:hypothetical protein
VSGPFEDYPSPADTVRYVKEVPQIAGCRFCGKYGEVPSPPTLIEPACEETLNSAAGFVVSIARTSWKDSPVKASWRYSSVTS